MNGAIYTIYSLLPEYVKVSSKFNLLHRINWVTPEIHILRTSPRMENLYAELSVNSWKASSFFTQKFA